MKNNVLSDKTSSVKLHIRVKLQLLLSYAVIMFTFHMKYCIAALDYSVFLFDIEIVQICDMLYIVK